MSRKTRQERRKSGFVGKAVALLLGFILGIVGTIGGIVGGGYYVLSSVKIKDAVNGVAGVTGTQIDYSEYITEEYAEKTVLGVIGSLGSVAQEFQNGTGNLSTLEKISPYVRTAISKLAEATTAYGVHIDVDSLMTTPFGELAAFAQNTVNSVELGKVIETVTGNTSGMISLLCYGEEGVHYEIDGEGKVVMLGSNKPLTVGALTTDEGLNGVLNNISLAGLMKSVGSVDANDAIMRTLLYGTMGVDYEMVGDEIQMKPVYFVYNETADAFMDDSKTVYTKTADGYASENGVVIKKNTVQALSASNEETETYEYSVYDKNGKLIYELKTPDGGADGYFAAYKNDVEQKHRGLTIGDLMGGKDLTSIFQTLVLGDFLVPEPQNANAIQLAISYGEKNVHYTILPDNTVQMLPMQIAVLDGNAYDVYGAKLNAEVANSVTNPPNVDGYEVTLENGGRYYLSKDATVDDEDGYQKTIKVDGGEALLFYAANATTGAPEYYSAHTIGSFLTGTIFNDMLNALTIGDIMGGDISQESTLLYAIKDWKINSFKDSKKINSLKLSDVIQVGDNAPSALKAIKDWTIAELTSEEKFNGLTIGDLIEVKENSPEILKTLSTWTLAKLQTTNAFDELKIGDLIEVDTSSPKILQTISTWSIAELKTTGKFDGLRIDELIEIDLSAPNTSSVLKEISTWTIGELKQQSKFDEVKIGSIFSVTESSPAILRALQNKTLGAMKDPATFDGLLIGDIFEVTTTSPAILRALQNKTLGAMKDPATLDGLLIGDIFEVTTTSPAILRALQNKTLGAMKDSATFDGLLIGDIFEVTTTSPAILKALQNKALGAMKDSATFDGLLIGDIFEVTTSSPAILKALQDKTLGAMKDSATFDGLLIGDIFEVTTTSPAILKALQDKTLGDMKLTSTFDGLLIGDIFEVTNTSPAILKALQDKTLGDMKLTSTFDDLQIGKVFDVTDDSPAILQALKDKTLGDMKLASTFDDLEIGKVFGVTDDSPAILKALQDKTLGDMKLASTFDDLEIGKVFGVTDDSPAILKALQNKSLGDMKEQATFDSLTLVQVLGEEEVQRSKYFRTIGNTKISELSTAIEGLSLTELFGNDIFRTITLNGVTHFAYTDLDVDGNEVLYRLYEKTEGGVMKFYLEGTYQTQVEILNTHIRHMPTFVNGAGEIQLLYHDDGVYYLDREHTQDSGYTQSQVTYHYYTAQNRLYEKADEHGEILYYEDAEFSKLSDREAEGIWHYMLVNEDGVLETHPTLGDMDSMVDNMQNNIRKATLNELEEDGIVEFEDGEDNITEYRIKKHIELQTGFVPIVFDIGDSTSSYADKTYIGELTVMEMLEYIGDVFKAIDELESGSF